MNKLIIAIFIHPLHNYNPLRNEGVYVPQKSGEFTFWIAMEWYILSKLLVVDDLI